MYKDLDLSPLYTAGLLCDLGLNISLLWGFDWSLRSLLPLESCELESLSAGKTARLPASRFPSMRESCVCTLNLSMHLGGIEECHDVFDGSSLTWHFSVPMPTEGRKIKKLKNTNRTQKPSMTLCLRKNILIATCITILWGKNKRNLCWALMAGL